MNDIIIKIPQWKFEKLIEKIDLVKKGIRLTKMNQILKDVLMDDLYAIDSIIKLSKKGEGK